MAASLAAAFHPVTLFAKEHLLQRRNAIQGNIADLDTYRQQQPPAYPLPQFGTAC